MNERIMFRSSAQFEAMVLIGNMKHFVRIFYCTSEREGAEAEAGGEINTERIIKAPMVVFESAKWQSSSMSW
jgi:hypothetical protein